LPRTKKTPKTILSLNVAIRNHVCVCVDTVSLWRHRVRVAEHGHEKQCKLTNTRCCGETDRTHSKDLGNLWQQQQQQ